MHEEEKINEAAYFLSKMTASLDNPKAFRFELSAFLAAARSVLQYAREEAKAKPGGQAWYDAHVSGNPEIQFFTDKRDISIHARPVVPTTNVSIVVTEVIRMSDSVSIQVLDKEGKVVHESTSSSSPPPPTEPPPPSVSYSYTFPDWAGTEDVVALCSRYLTLLEGFVNDGLAKGFLKPAA